MVNNCHSIKARGLLDAIATSNSATDCCKRGGADFKNQTLGQFNDAELFPSDRFIAFFAEAALGELSRDRFRRLAFKQSLQKCVCEAADHATDRACCRALTRVAEDCTTRAACCRARD
jgi:hypothetical protein